jgi:hypothetical protein
MNSAAIRRTVLFTVIVAASLLVNGALAARRPTGAEQRAILAAIHHSSLTRAAPAVGYRVASIRVATVARGWAEALLVPRRPNAGHARSLGAVLRRRAGRWRVTLVGGIGLGCRVPWPVRHDLGLIC